MTRRLRRGKVPRRRRWIRHRRRSRRRRRDADAGAGRAARPRRDALVGPRPRPRRARHARLRPGARGGARRAGSSTAGGTAVLGGVLPTPAVALLAQDLGLVVSASHNPPEYNGVKVFDREGHKLDGRGRARDRGARRRRRAPAAARSSTPRTPSTGYVDHVARALRLRPHGLRIAVDCANGAYSAIAPAVFERLGAEVTAIADAPDGDEHQRRLRRHRPLACSSGRPRRRLRPRRRVRR